MQLEEILSIETKLKCQEKYDLRPLSHTFYGWRTGKESRKMHSKLGMQLQLKKCHRINHSIPSTQGFKSKSIN